MTKAHSEVGDNNGLCELCDRGDGGAQMAVPILLGGGMGWGTMWMCAQCRDKRKARQRIDKSYYERTCGPAAPPWNVWLVAQS